MILLISCFKVRQQSHFKLVTLGGKAVSAVIEKLTKELKGYMSHCGFEKLDDINDSMLYFR